jgi:cytochrome c biogenesis protein CcdA
MFGIGMAVVLGGLGLLIARVGKAATRAEDGWLGSPWARRIGPWVPVVAGTVVLVSGVAFALTAAGQLS